MSKLTPKQEKFCVEYLKDFNGTRAAIEAGYSKKTARKIAHENLTKPDIRERMKKLLKKANPEDPETSIRRCIVELEMIAFADMKDFAKWGKHGIEQWTPSDDLDHKSRLVQEISESITQGGGSRKLKLHDKRWAFEMLGKYYGFLKERVDHTSSDGSMSPVVNIVIPSNGREASDDESE